ncbi:MAG: nucleotidyltransferase domain-containing protein [Deltaproteobacteria bacterium]|nr:nucleotidyltransferase domain-containing protein [Deltaproteobacteria bacterium]
MADSAIYRLAQNYLKRLIAIGIPVEYGIIYGSHARGQATKWSDIDLLVVSPRFYGPRTREDLNLLWRVAAREDSRIEPIPCGSIEWERSRESALIEAGRREGIKVAAK